MCGGPENGAQEKNGFMDCHQVGQIAHFTPSGGSRGLVCGKVYRMQHIAERFIPHGWEKPEVAIHYPFQARGLVLPDNFGDINRRRAPNPSDVIACRFKLLAIAQRRYRNPFLAVVKTSMSPEYRGASRFKGVAPAT